MTNKGHELTLNLKPIQGMVRGLTWDLFATYARNVNEVTKVTDEIDELVIGQSTRTGINIVAKEGLPYGTFKGQSVQMTPDGQTIVDSDGFPVYTDDDVFLGNYQPNYNLNFGTNINYKGVGFNILFDLKDGGNYISQTKFSAEFNGTTELTTEQGREPYIFPNSVVDNGDGTFSPNETEITEQDFYTVYDPSPATYLIDASYLKLREVGISYTVPKSVLKDMSISDVRIGIFGRNLKFWLPSENAYADPEINGPSLTDNAVGIETTQTPPAKSYGISLGLKF